MHGFGQAGERAGDEVPQAPQHPTVTAGQRTMRAVGEGIGRSLARCLDDTAQEDLPDSLRALVEALDASAAGAVTG